MKKRYLGLTLAMLGLLPISAQAAFDTNSDVTVNEFASELTISGSGTALANPGNIMDTTSDCGFGAADGATRYLRYDLSNGAEFVANPTSLTLDGQVGSLSAGGISESYAIYAWTSVGGTVAADDAVLLITAAGITATSQTGVTISYAMYETAGNAVNQTSPLASSSGQFITFDAALDVTKDDVAPKTIDVVNGSVTFSDAAPVDNKTTVIGDVNVLLDASVLEDDGLAAAMVTLISDSSLVVTGNFSASQNLTGTTPNGTYTGAALNRVYIDDNGGCDNVNTAVTSLSATTATFDLNQAEVADAATICMKVNGYSTITPGDYTAVYTPTAQAGRTKAATNLGTIGTIAKDSESLQSPWFSSATSASYGNRFILTNMGSTDVTYAITVYTEDGSTATLKAPYNGTVTLTAGDAKVINTSDILTMTGTTRASILIDFFGDTSTIQGAYQYYNTTTGLMSTVTMTSPN